MYCPVSVMIIKEREVNQGMHVHQLSAIQTSVISITKVINSDNYKLTFPLDEESLKMSRVTKMEN